MPLFVFALPAFSAQLSHPYQVIVVEKISGSAGEVKVFHKNGIMRVLKQKDLVRAGDTVATGASSSVDLRLSDGSVVHLSKNTRYLIKEIRKEKNGFWSWAFFLTVGKIRALVRTTKKSGFVKFKVHTQTGSIGVRGTDFLLSYSPQSQETKLSTLIGEVLLGPADANFKNASAFQIVGAGQTSIISKKKRKVSLPTKSDSKDVKNLGLILQDMQIKEDAKEKGQKDFDKLMQEFADKMNKIDQEIQQEIEKIKLKKKKKRIRNRSDKSLKDKNARRSKLRKGKKSGAKKNAKAKKGAAKSESKNVNLKKKLEGEQPDLPTTELSNNPNEAAPKSEPTGATQKCYKQESETIPVDDGSGTVRNKVVSRTVDVPCGSPGAIPFPPSGQPGSGGGTQGLQTGGG